MNQDIHKQIKALAARYADCGISEAIILKMMDDHGKPSGLDDRAKLIGVWMCRNQLGRRNITNEVRTVLIGEAYRAQRMSVGNHAEKKRDGSGKFSVSHQSGVIRETQSTEGIIAKQFGVGNGTVQRAKQFVDSIDVAEKVSPGFRESILSGEVKAPKNLVSEIRNIPEEKRTAALDPGERCDCNEYQNAATRGNLRQLAADCRAKKKPLRCYSTRTAGWKRF